jgi:hypothetical protein
MEQEIKLRDLLSTIRNARVVRCSFSSVEGLMMTRRSRNM